MLAGGRSHGHQAHCNRIEELPDLSDLKNDIARAVLTQRACGPDLGFRRVRKPSEQGDLLKRYGFHYAFSGPNRNTAPTLGRSARGYTINLTAIAEAGLLAVPGRECQRCFADRGPRPTG